MSLARGVAAVARSIPLLAVTFGGALVLWLTYSSTGVVRVTSPGAMAQLESLPPIQSLLDAQFLFTAQRVYTGAAVAVAAIVIFAIRAALTIASVHLLARAFAPSPQPEQQEESRVPVAKIPAVLALEATFLVVTYLASVVLGALLGSLGLLLALVGVQYLLVYAPIVLIVEPETLRGAARLAVRAARLPGREHILLVLAYVTVTVILIQATAQGPWFAATPSLLVWIYALFANFLHMSVLGAFTYRWFAVRDDARAAAGAAEAEREARSASRRLLGRGGRA